MATDASKTEISILTGTYRIKGYVDLLPGNRIIDYMQGGKDFIKVTDAEVWELAAGGRKVMSAPFVDVARGHIQVILPGHGEQ